MPAVPARGRSSTSWPSARSSYAPALTLTSGLAAAHQAITGDRLALTLDHELCRAGHRRRPAGAARPGLGRRDRPVHGGDAARQGQPVLPRAGVPARAAARRHAADRDPGGRAPAEQAARRPGRRPASRRCGSPPRTRRAGPCWTSGAAPCCRCATRPRRPGTPMTSTGSAGTRRRRTSRAVVSGWRLDRFARRCGRAAASRPARRAELRGGGRRRGLQRARAGQADPQHRRGASRRRRGGRRSAWSTAGTPSAWRCRRPPAPCRRWSR